MGGTVDQRPGYVRLHGVDHGQGRMIRRGKGIEVGGGDLGGSVAPEELVVEEETDLGDHKMPRDDEGSQKVIGGVVL